jgi:Domain of Unknown Function (DUF1080)
MKAVSKITILSAALLCFTFMLASYQSSRAQISTNVGNLFDKPPGPKLTYGLYYYQPTNRVELFNGKDFAGWTFFMRSNSAPENTWSITNGLIHCAGKPNGFMRTEKSYSNYVCTVEWRFLKPGNTGVLVDMQLPDNVWPQCVECQGMHDHQGDFWLWGGATPKEPVNNGRNGVKMPNPSAENPVGEWNTYQTVCRGDTVEIIVNAKSMNKITGLNLSSGFIGLQSEGAEFEVRKVYLEPLK